MTIGITSRIFFKKYLLYIWFIYPPHTFHIIFTATTQENELGWEKMIGPSHWRSFIFKTTFNCCYCFYWFDFIFFCFFIKRNSKAGFYIRPLHPTNLLSDMLDNSSTLDGCLEKWFMEIETNLAGGSEKGTFFFTLWNFN